MAYVCISIESIAKSYNCSSTPLHKPVHYYCRAFLPLFNCSFSIASMRSSACSYACYELLLGEGKRHARQLLMRDSS